MLRVRVIPCLDVREGRVVKGVRFRDLRDSGAPAELALEYERQGADELVLLDITATTQRRGTALATVQAVREVLSIPLTVGGGVGSVADAQDLLDAGADRISVNTAAVERPELVTELAERFGRQCTVIAIDAAGDGSGGYRVVLRSGMERTGLCAIDWARRVTALGAGEILLTSLDRDGTRLGYQCELLRRCAATVTVSIIASGGADSPAHLLEALENGADAVLAASIFHEGRYSVADVKALLAQEGVEVRPC
jgi:imidazole glycerol-phosphate synthase subunit HisF